MNSSSATSAPNAEHWGPRQVIWENSEQLVRMLEEPDGRKTAIAIVQRVVDGARCYVVESQSSDRKWGGETIISPRQGYLPISRKWTVRGQVYSSYTLQGAHEVAAGIWAPDRIEDESISVREDGASRLFSRRRMQIVEYRPRQVPPAAAFQLEIPYGVDVTDRRLGWSYHNDPWWPEVGAMLREKYHWPPPDFTALKNFSSASQRKLDGQPAPPLRIASWLNSEPMDLAALRGKVVLVEFGNILDFYEPQYAPALRELYSVYHPAGLEILSIHAPTEDMDAVRRFARDYRLPYPVVIDEGKPGSQGVTAEAFAIRGRVCAFLIDQEGKVHSAGEPTIGGGRVVETIVSLLKKAGARDVKAVSLDTPRLPDQAINDAKVLYRAGVRAALDANPPGKIVGRIVDDRHQPVAGVNVLATLQFSMLELTSPGINYLVPYRAADERFRATTGKDGRFELSGLCKGEYAVKVEAPGRAWKERKAFLAPDLKPASVEFVLDQGDAISGQIRDPEGKPIANATVMPTERQHYVNDEFQYTTGVEGNGVTTDGAGRFRLGRLQEGRYVIEVKAAGYKVWELEAIWAGNENVVVTLERSP